MLNTPSEILTGARNGLNELIRQGAVLRQLTQKIQKLLPSHLAAHCSVAALEGEELIVHVSNAAAGTVLRYQLPKLLPLVQLDPLCANIKQMTCHIRPPTSLYTSTSHQQPKPKLRVHSPETVNLLQSASQDISCPEVKSALARLAQTLDKKNN